MDNNKITTGTYQDRSQVFYKPGQDKDHNAIEQKVEDSVHINLNDREDDKIELGKDQVKKEIPVQSVETVEKALKEFETIQEKFEKGDNVREKFELSLEHTTEAMKWIVKGPKYGDRSEESMWHKIHHQIPEMHMERMEKALEIMEDVGESIEIPLILGMDGYQAWSAIQKIQLQEKLVVSLQAEVKELEKTAPKDGSLEKLKVKLAGEEEKLDHLNKASDEQIFSFVSSLGKAMLGKLDYVWKKLSALDKAGKIDLHLSQEVVDKIGLGLKGGVKGVKLILALRKAYKLITEDYIPLCKEVKKLELKINHKDTGEALKKELEIRKIFLQCGKGWEIAKKAFFTFLDIAGAGLGIAEFIALTFLGITTLASPLGWIGMAITATIFLISTTLYIYEQSPRLENWFEQRSLRGRVKELERQEKQIKETTVEKLDEAKDNVMRQIGTANQLVIESSNQDALKLGFTVGQTVTKEKIQKKYKEWLDKATVPVQEHIKKLKETMETMDKIAQERIFCRKKRMDYEGWRETVIKVSGSMTDDTVKNYRRKHLEELSKEAKTTTQYDRYRRYIHHFEVDPVKAWVAYLTNEQYENLKFRDPKEAELNIASRGTYAWDNKSYIAFKVKSKKEQLDKAI